MQSSMVHGHVWLCSLAKSSRKLIYFTCKDSISRSLPCQRANLDSWGNEITKSNVAAQAVRKSPLVLAKCFRPNLP